MKARQIQITLNIPAECTVSTRQLELAVLPVTSQLLVAVERWAGTKLDEPVVTIPEVGQDEPPAV